MRRILTWMLAKACWKCLERMSQTPQKKTDSSDYLTILYWVACAVCKPSRDSSVGRASDRRFEGPRFDPGSRDALCSPVLIGHQHKTSFFLRDANENIIIFLRSSHEKMYCLYSGFAIWKSALIWFRNMSICKFHVANAHCQRQDVLPPLQLLAKQKHG